MQRPLKDGVAFCNHCGQIFESNLRNRLLSGSWCLRRHYWTKERFLEVYGVDETEATLIYSMVVLECFSHDEVLQALTAWGIDENVKTLPDFADNVSRDKNMPICRPRCGEVGGSEQIVRGTED